MTDGLLDRWDAQQHRVSALHRSASRRTVAFTAITRGVRQGIQVAMLALGAHLVLAQHASAGVMIATTILLGRAVQPVEQLVATWRLLIDARAAYRRLAELADDLDDGPARLRLGRPVGRLAVDGVAFRAPGADRLVLSGVSFALAPGEVLAVVGPSGAGKSTLARVLTGVWSPATGVVRLDGADVAPGRGRTSARGSATCRRTSSCSTAPSPRTSPAWARCTRRR
jgi:ABC-type protease/lipase transport system fused ATPase/permease subunit